MKRTRALQMECENFKSVSESMIGAVLSDCRGCGWFVVRAGWEDRCPAGGELQAAFWR